MKMARNNLQAAHERKFFTGELANKIRRGKIMNNKRSGASLINVLIFMFAAMMITAQVFFFFENESISLKEDREILQVRMRLENLVEIGKTLLTPKSPSPTVDYETFINTKLDGFPKDYWDNSCHLCIHDLNYTLKKTTFKPRNWEKYKADKTPERVFPPMGADYYLIRAYTSLSSGNSLMLQVLVHNGKTLTYEEIWY